VLAVSYFVELLAPLLNLPAVLRALSVFHLYGQPITEGVRWVDAAVMLLLIAAFTAAGAGLFARRDIAR
jgi:ABC-2 type transport system permease protein